MDMLDYVGKQSQKVALVDRREQHRHDISLNLDVGRPRTQAQI